MKISPRPKNRSQVLKMLFSNYWIHQEKVFLVVQLKRGSHSAEIGGQSGWMKKKEKEWEKDWQLLWHSWLSRSLSKLFVVPRFASRYRQSLTSIDVQLDVSKSLQGDRIAQDIELLLLDQVQCHFKMFFIGNFDDVEVCNKKHCWLENGLQWLDNVDRTLLVVTSGKLASQNNTKLYDSCYPWWKRSWFAWNQSILTQPNFNLESTKGLFLASWWC